MNTRKHWVAALAVLALSACGGPQSGGAAGLPAGCIAPAPEQIGGPIDLVNQDGAPTTQAAFAGAPALVYFGFTYCPDVCPLAMQSARATFAQLGPAAADIKPVLVSLDPARDTPEAMRAYVGTEVFPDGLVGLTGTEAQTAAAAKAFRVGWQKAEVDSAADYLINHTSFFYLQGPDWRTLAMYPSDLSPEDAATCIKAGLAGAP